MTTFNKGQLLAEVKRELAMRKQQYPRWVKSGSMTRQSADQQIEAMTGVYQALQNHMDPETRIEVQVTKREQSI